eukprot:1702124-Amphidinium_carterae.1
MKPAFNATWQSRSTSPRSRGPTNHLGQVSKRDRKAVQVQKRDTCSNQRSELSSDLQSFIQAVYVLLMLRNGSTQQRQDWFQERYQVLRLHSEFCKLPNAAGKVYLTAEVGNDKCRFCFSAWLSLQAINTVPVDIFSWICEDRRAAASL